MVLFSIAFPLGFKKVGFGIVNLSNRISIATVSGDRGRGDRIKQVSDALHLV
jgi:hypothetical protein